MLLKSNDNKISKIYELEFKLEKDIQSFIEKNLESLLNLEIIKSEFTIENYRFDTLAFDNEAKSFVIIEYKKSSNFSVIDQGYSYLGTMLNNKAEFILDYNERMGKTLARNDVDWSQSRIVFISPNFTKYQKDSINFKDLPIQLFEIKKYENDIISFEEIKSKNSSESIKAIAPTNDKKEAIKEIKVYSETDLLVGSTQEVKELYETFKSKVEEMLPEIETKPLKRYVAFKQAQSNIICVIPQKTQIKIYLNLGETVKDEKQIGRDVSDIGHWGTVNYEIILLEKNLEYILSLIKDIWNSN